MRLADKWEREGDRVLKALLHDPRWTEIILLTAGHLGESSQYRATRWVQTILAARSEYENILHRDLLMAARCLADDIRVDTQVRRAIVTKLLKLYFDFTLPRALREDIGQVFVRLGRTTVEKDVLAVLLKRRWDRRQLRLRSSRSYLNYCLILKEMCARQQLRRGEISRPIFGLKIDWKRQNCFSLLLAAAMRNVATLATSA